MRNTDENNIFDEIGNEDRELFKKFFESQSSKITLPESLKSENLSKKYKDEIEKAEIENKTAPVEKKNNILPFTRGKKISVAAACIAFAVFLFFGADALKNDTVYFENEAEAPKERPALMAKAEEIPAEDAVFEKEETEKADILGDKPAGKKPEGNSLLGRMPVTNTEKEELKEDGIAPPKDPEPSPDILFQANPATGAIDMIDAAKFLYLSGADNLLDNSIKAEIIEDFSDHKNHLQNKKKLYEGFIQRLY